MKDTFLFLPLFFISFLSVAQARPGLGENKFAATDSMALLLNANGVKNAAEVAQYINQNFKTDEDKLRAGFIWVASNFDYDYENMYAINFDEKREDRLAKAFATHKGICFDYASILSDIYNACDFKSYVVSGYCWPTGMNSYLSHAWCVVYIDNDWYVMEPTWGSGYIKGNQFVKKISNIYYKMSPRSAITSHMPFDPLWECLDYPITNEEFYKNNVTAAVKRPVFHYKDSILKWENQSQYDQLVASARRTERNGVKNSMTYDYLLHLKSHVKFIDDSTKNTTKFLADSTKVHIYNEASAQYNSSVKLFNQFIAYRNKQFKPNKPDADIKAMLADASKAFAEAKAKAYGLKEPSESLKPILIQLKNMMVDFEFQIKAQEDWLKKYMSKGKLGRHAMFFGG